MRMLRLTVLSLALAWGAASADGGMSMRGLGAGGAAPKAPGAQVRLPAPATPPIPAATIPRPPGAATPFAAESAAPAGAHKGPPERSWSTMKNRPMSPPAAPRAFARAKGVPKLLPPGGGVPGKGVRALKLTPLDQGIGRNPPLGRQPSNTHRRTRKARSDTEKKDEATKKAVADNIRG